MKRMIALVLSLVMALSLCAPAWGADPEVDIKVKNSEELVAAINGDATKIGLENGDYELKFTHNTAFNVDGLTIVGLGDAVKLDISSTEVSYGRIQGDNVVFENIIFTDSTVGATGKATYNNCTIEGQLECASSGAAETVANNCVIGQVHTSTDMNAGAASFTKCKITSAAYNAKSTMTFTECVIADGLSIWGGDTVLNKCTIDPEKISYVGSGEDTIVMDDSLVASDAATLITAMKAATSGATIKLLKDITITNKWDCRYTGAKFLVPVTIDGNGNTLKFTNEINDGYNYLCAFRFEAAATVKNLTFDMSEAIGVFQNRFGAISAKADLTVDNCKFYGNPAYASSRAIIFGEGSGAGITEMDVSVTNSVFKDWKYGVTDNMNRQDAKTVTITDNKFNNAGVNVSASETVTFNDNTVEGKGVTITSYTDNTELAVTANGNTLDASAENKINAKTVATDSTVFALYVTGTVTAPDDYVVVKNIDSNDDPYYKLQQAVAAPEGDTATSETTNNVAENVQEAVKEAVASGTSETTVTAGETKIEFNDVADMGTFAAAATEDITTQIVVEDVTETVETSVKADVEALVEEKIGAVDDENVVVAAYVEIDIHVFVDGGHVGQITELPEKIKVTIPLPAGVTAEAGKKYYVAHEHDGVVELLNATIEGEYLVFYSDTFSTYAVVTQTAPTSAGVALTDKVDMVATNAAQTKYPNVTVSVHKANAPKDTNKDGRFDVSGNVKYFMMNGQEYVQVNTVSEADYTVYVAGTKTLFGYFKAANPFYYGYGVPFNNFGDKCGQYDDEPVAGTKYYTFETNLYKAVEAGTTEDFNLMVGNELVPVELMSDEWVEHVAAYTYDKNYKVVGVKCAECGAPATLYANFASLPKAVQKGVQGVDYFAIGDSQYYVWAAPAVPSTDKLVESAKTADPIGLYIGVTALATLGSALLAKKKED